MPHANCCLCLRRIKSNQRKRKITQPHLVQDFYRFVKNVKPETKFTDYSFICGSCHVTIRAYSNWNIHKSVLALTSANLTPKSDQLIRLPLSREVNMEILMLPVAKNLEMVSLFYFYFCIQFFNINYYAGWRVSQLRWLFGKHLIHIYGAENIHPSKNFILFGSTVTIN